VHRLKSQRGQALVEFALILPILLAVIIGIFDFGSAYNQKNSQNFLVNQAARYASVNACAPCATGQTIASYVRSTADTSHLRGSSTHVTFCLPLLSGGGANNGSVGNPLQVTVTSPFDWLGVLVNTGLPGGSITIKATVTTRILQPSDGTLYSASAC
jgi:Flp pilus assembly protein TadG